MASGTIPLDYLPPHSPGAHAYDLFWEARARRSLRVHLGIAGSRAPAAGSRMRSANAKLSGTMRQCTCMRMDMRIYALMLV